MRRAWFRCAIASVLAVLAVWPASAGATVAEGQISEATAKATAWFRAQQTSNGALGANGGLDPAWAFLGLAGAGVNAADLRTGPGAPSAQDYYLSLWTGANDETWTSAGTPQASDYERVIMLARAAGLDPLRLSARQNLLAKLAHFDHSGYFGLATNLNQTMFALIALDQLPVPGWLTDQVAENIEENAHDDGGWTFATAATPEAKERPGEIDLTGAAIAGLCGAGRSSESPAVAAGIAFLESERSPNGQIGNVDSTSWALDGLGACGVVRGSAGWTGGDEETIEWLLSRQLAEGAWPSANTANYYATQDALRALVAPGFAAEPPARAVPGEPVRRQPPTVAVGTPVPTVLAIDAGFGSIQLCSTTAPVGATLPEVLSAARAGSDPANCVSQFRAGAEGVTSVNGAVAESGSGGGWKLSLDGGAEVDAMSQTVGWGQVVGLRLDHPSALTVSETELEFEPTALGEADRALGVSLTNHTGAVLSIGSPAISGPAQADYSVVTQSCAGLVLAPGSGCSVSVAFTPGAVGERAATLEIPVEGREAVVVALRGEGISASADEEHRGGGEASTDAPPSTPAPTAGQVPPVSTAPKTRAPVLQGITHLDAAGLRLRVSTPGAITIRIARASGSGRARYWRNLKTLFVRAAKAGPVKVRFPRLRAGSYRVTVVLPDGKALNRSLTIPTREARKK
jgi:hypothetical protein